MYNKWQTNIFAIGIVLICHTLFFYVKMSCYIAINVLIKIPFPPFTIAKFTEMENGIRRSKIKYEGSFDCV